MEKRDKEELIIKLGMVFYISSIIGYIYELILCYFYTGKVFSHGMFNGPWLPIYGIGAVLLTYLEKYHKKPILIFILSFLGTALLEYLCGLILLKFFHTRLWDYTGHFLNIGGHVCFLSAFCFGIGGLLVVYLLYPLIKKIYIKVNKKILTFILTLLSIVFSGDVIATILK